MEFQELELAVANRKVKKMEMERRLSDLVEMARDVALIGERAGNCPRGSGSLLPLE